MKNFKNFIVASYLLIFLENCYTSGFNPKDNSEELNTTNKSENHEYIQNPNTIDENIDKSLEQVQKAEANKNEMIRNYFDNIKCPVMKFLVDKNIITEEKVYNLISGVEKYENIEQLKISTSLLSPKDLLALFGYKLIPDLCKRRWSYKNKMKIYSF
ncbi:hypothetical protein DMUE_5594, partial [Dictyocoela muelleri]